LLQIAKSLGGKGTKRKNKEATQIDNTDMRKMGGDKRSLSYSFRLYLNANGERVLGKGGALILEAIDEHGSIALAAEQLGMSYKFVWDYLGRMKQRLGRPLIMSRRGGTPHTRRRGGGGTTLTPLGRRLLGDFRATEIQVRRMLSERKPSLSQKRAGY
jgi:molybdate transport system regulatory protein